MTTQTENQKITKRQNMENLLHLHLQCVNAIRNVLNETSEDPAVKEDQTTQAAIAETDILRYYDESPFFPISIQ